MSDPIQRGQYPHVLAEGIVKRHLTDDEARERLPLFAEWMGMVPIGPPAVNVCPGHPWGGSFVQGLQESHMSMHYWSPPKNGFAFDLFTCQTFWQEEALTRRVWEGLEAFLEVELAARIRVIWRGTFLTR